MTGKLLKAADLCEQTYGKGSFREVGEWTEYGHEEEASENQEEE